MLVITPYGQLCLPKVGPASGRVINYMFDMVEPNCSLYFEKIVKQENSRLFIDVGAASDGWYSIKACKLNPKIKVIAVEPNNREYSLLANNLSLNCSGRFLPIKAALSNVETELDLLGEKVQCTTLDCLLTTYRVVSHENSIIKIDVEGMGLQVLKGGLKTIQTGNHTIILEVHNAAEAKASLLLSKLGYTIVTLPGALIATRTYPTVPN